MQNPQAQILFKTEEFFRPKLDILPFYFHPSGVAAANQLSVIRTFNLAEIFIPATLNSIWARDRHRGSNACPPLWLHLSQEVTLDEAHRGP